MQPSNIDLFAETDEEEAHIIPHQNVVGNHIILRKNVIHLHIIPWKNVKICTFL